MMMNSAANPIWPELLPAKVPLIMPDIEKEERILDECTLRCAAQLLQNLIKRFT